MRLNHKVAVVTGGASGIGKAIVQRFADEGAQVAFCDISEGAGRRVEEEMVDRGGRVRFVHADVSNEAEIASLVDGTMERCGRIDIVVNNAFFAGAQGPNALTLTNEDWERSINVNLRGAWWLAQRALPHMLAQGEGVVLNVSSRLAFRASPDSFAYCITKAGLVQMARCLAIDFGRRGIRACAICPGLVETPATERVWKDPETRARAVQKRYVNRLATPEDIAGAAVFLASDEAAHIQGEALVIDGGASIG